MGYLGNHLATVTSAVFAVILTALWPYFTDFAPILNFVFIMAVPIMWFMVLICWLAQKSTDYTHGNSSSHSHSESTHTTQTVQTLTTGTQVAITDIKQIQDELTSELNSLKTSVELKDDEIERLNQEISNLQTMVQIESLKAELANLKVLASKRK